MQTIAIYKDSKGFIFTPLSKTNSGLYVSTEPELRVYYEDRPSQIIQAMKLALTSCMDSAEEYPPRGMVTNIKAKVKEKLERLDIKSFSELDKAPTKYCIGEKKEKSIVLIPSRRDLKKGKGYELINERKMKIDGSSDDNELLEALLEVFKVCEP